MNPVAMNNVVFIPTSEFPLRKMRTGPPTNRKRSGRARPAHRSHRQFRLFDPRTGRKGTRPAHPPASRGLTRPSRSEVLQPLRHRPELRRLVAVGVGPEGEEAAVIDLFEGAE